MTDPGVIRIEGARIIFRNFEGRPGKYNAPGERNFAVVLEEDMAQILLEDGWNVRWLDPREDAEEGTERVPFLSVNVKYGTRRTPRVALITSRGLTDLKEHEVETIDQVNIINCDMMIRPWGWENNGKKGISAYLQSIYVTIEEDELELKYADLPKASG
jgi:hypothetical protein